MQAAPGASFATQRVNEQIREMTAGSQTGKCGCLFERSASRGTKVKNRHALEGTVMGPALRRDLPYTGVLDAGLFVQQGARFVELVGLRRKSHPRIDAIGGPGTRVYDGVVGQCDHMECRRLNAALPAFGKMDPRWLISGEHYGLRKRVLESLRLKETISTID